MADDVTAVAMAVRELVRAVDAYRGARAEAAGRVAVGDIIALGHLFVQGPQTPTELARRLRVTTASMTELLDRMARREWVVRAPHPHDRRRILIHLTETGREIITDVYREFAARLAPVYEELPGEHRRVVTDFLRAATLRLTADPPGEPQRPGVRQL